MNFKKLALVAALATSFGAYAADPTFGALTLSATSEYTVEDATPEVQAEIAAAAGDEVVEGNQAYVVQEGTAHLAYISQTTDTDGSFAAILQMGEGALGLIYQTGSAANKALIVSIGKSTANDAAAYDVADADTTDKLTTLGKAAIAKTSPVAVMNASANVAVINQDSSTGTNSAIIEQNVGTATVDSNFAAIAQTAGTFNNMGMIAQMGTLNKALIVQSN